MTARTLKLTWFQFLLEQKMFWRNPSAAFFNFLLPLIFLALFGSIFSSDQKELNILVPGIAGMAVMTSTFSSLAFAMTFMREQGILKRIRGTPLPSISYLGGRIGTAIVNTVIQVAIIIIAGRIFFNVPWPSQWFELVVFLAVGVACFAALGIALSHVIPNFDSAPAYINAVFLPLIFISGVFYNVDKMPVFLRDIANALPLKHLIEGLSGSIVTGESLSHNLSSLAILAAWAIVGIFLAVRGFSWESKSD